MSLSSCDVTITNSTINEIVYQGNADNISINKDTSTEYINTEKDNKEIDFSSNKEMTITIDCNYNQDFIDYLKEYARKYNEYKKYQYNHPTKEELQKRIKTQNKLIKYSKNPMEKIRLQKELDAMKNKLKEMK